MLRSHSWPPFRWWPRSSCSSPEAPPAARQGGRHLRSQANPVTIATRTARVTISRKPPGSCRHSPTATETLFAIGAGQQIVAVDDRSDFPTGRHEQDPLGIHAGRRGDRRRTGPTSWSSYDSKGSSARSGSWGSTVVHYDGARRFAEAYQRIRQLGIVTGHLSEAKRLVRCMRARIERIDDASSPKGCSSPSPRPHPDFFSATSKTFVGRVYAALGLRNIADAAGHYGTGYPQLSAEYVVSANPT